MIKTEKELRAKIATCTGNLKCKFEGTNGKRALIVCGGTGCLSSDSAAIIEEIERQIDFQEKWFEHILVRESV